MLQQQETIEARTRTNTSTHHIFYTGQPEQTQQTPGGSVDALLATLAEERRKRLRRTRQYQALGLGLVAVVLLCALITWIRTGRFPSDMLSMFASMAGLLGITAAATRSEKQATRSLARFDDVRAVGPLAEALALEDKQARAVAEDALIRLLPRLKANDTHLLNTDQRKCLHRRLYRSTYGFQVELALSILKALEQVGDERDVAVVQRLASGNGRSEKYRRIQAAAKECLPYLQRRAAEQLSRQSLLRAADRTATPSNQLVRPAGKSNPEEAWMLLRACLADDKALTGSDSKMVWAILDDLEATGDRRALPYVEQLAAIETLPSELHSAAQRCLLHLHSSAEPPIDSPCAARQEWPV